ncbi:MlaE family lipid ABC transporter permease subunit [Acidihalobacter prosperus]
MTLARAQIEIVQDKVRFKGHWTTVGLSGNAAHVDPLRLPADAPLIFDLSELSALDTTGAWLIRRAQLDNAEQGREIRLQGAKPDVVALLELIESSQDPRNHPNLRRREGFFTYLGRQTVRILTSGFDFLSFVGTGTITALKTLGTPRHLRPAQILHTVDQAGAQALPLVGLLSLLIGMVIGYQSATFLEQYGANLYIADLVGISVLRELAPLMTAIIIAGRTGSAFTAQIGTMRVTEEIDALQTMGIRPMEMLVVPKVIGLVIALPLLTLFADAMGVLGGVLIGKLVLGISPADFVLRFHQSVSLTDFLIGIGKAPVFAMVIAGVGCYQGFQVMGSAESVGRHTTQSVVQSIFLVIVLDAMFSIIFNWLSL